MLQAKASGKNLSAQDTAQFYGLNRTPKGTRGESEDMTNMSSGQYPCASPALSRVVVNGTATALDVQAVAAPLGALEGFTGVAGGAFYYNGEKKSGNGITLGTGYAWQIVIYNNTYLIYGRNISNNQVLTFTYNVDKKEFKAGGTVMDKLIVTANKDGGGNYLMAYDYKYTEVYNDVIMDGDTVVFRNSDFFDKYGYNSAAPRANIFQNYFKVGEMVSISGFPSRSDNVGQVWSFNTTTREFTRYSNASYSENNTVDLDTYTDADDVSRWQVCTALVKGFKTTTHSVNGVSTYKHYIYFNLYNKDGELIDFSDVTGPNGTAYVSGVSITDVRICFDQMCFHDGRLWGTTVLGKHIYGSASDDLFSFSAEDINSGYAKRYTSLHWGKFTGLCSFKGYLVAFKEDVIQLVYVNRLETAAEGVGCIDPDSIAVTPNGVIFLGRKGFYIYNLSAPQLISSKLNMTYTAAVGAFDGNVYYASALRSDGARELIAYDMRYNMWHKRDDYNAKAMFRHRDKLYYIGKKMNTLSAETGTPGNWSFTLVKDNNDTLDNKGISELWIYADAASGATFTVHTATDNGEFVQHSTFTGTGGLMTFRCPVRIDQCTFYRIKITGTGSVTIHEIEAKTAANKGRRIKERGGTALPEPTAVKERIDYA